jgi:hypothetical protein
MKTVCLYNLLDGCRLLKTQQKLAQSVYALGLLCTVLLVFIARD